MIYRVTEYPTGKHIGDWHEHSGLFPLEAYPYLPKEIGKRVGVCGLTIERIA